eukprot:scaffold1720_cov353-Pavlova_lutheri.AAC.19
MALFCSVASVVGRFPSEDSERASDTPGRWHSALTSAMDTRQPPVPTSRREAGPFCDAGRHRSRLVDLLSENSVARTVPPPKTEGRSSAATARNVDIPRRTNGPSRIPRVGGAEETPVRGTCRENPVRDLPFQSIGSDLLSRSCFAGESGTSLGRWIRGTRIRSKTTMTETCPVTSRDFPGHLNGETDPPIPQKGAQSGMEDGQVAIDLEKVLHRLNAPRLASGKTSTAPGSSNSIHRVSCDWRSACLERYVISCHSLPARLASLPQ